MCVGAEGWAIHFSHLPFARTRIEGVQYGKKRTCAYLNAHTKYTRTPHDFGCRWPGIGTDTKSSTQIMIEAWALVSFGVVLIIIEPGRANIVALVFQAGQGGGWVREWHSNVI